MREWYGLAGALDARRAAAHATAIVALANALVRAAAGGVGGALAAAVAFEGVRRAAMAADAAVWAAQCALDVASRVRGGLRETVGAVAAARWLCDAGHKDCVCLFVCLFVRLFVC